MDLEVSTPISAEAEVKAYTLVGDDIYVKRYTNENIPTWYRQLISDIIASDNTITDLDAAVDYLSTLPAGYNQKITELQLADTTINTSLESLVTTTGSHTAAIANLDVTKVDATSAQAIARDTVGAYFADGTAGAWFNNQISTYASDIAANAMNIGTLSATLDGQSVRIDTVEEVNISQGAAISALDTALSTLSTSVGITLTDLQGQIDGAISTWFADGVPTNTNYPYTEWTTPEERANHVGDLYYDRLSGYAYRFVNEDLPSDTPDAGFIYWMRITDTDVVAALANAATAQDTADGKRTVFYSATAPTPRTINGTTIPIEIGDLWVHSTTKVTKVAVAVTPSVVWGDITNTAVENALLALVDLEEARDGNVVIFYETSTTIPVGMTYGDYLVDIDSWDGTTYTVYRYQNSTGGSGGTLAWYVNTGDTARALSSGYRSQVLAGTAQSTADGKVKVWYQTTAPTGLTASDVGDMWVDTDGGYKVQVWSSSAWVDPTTAQGSQAYTWSANASKLITSPDGNITGWSFGDGTNTKSYFRIQADKFEVSNSTTGYTPFSIVGTDVVFNGKVSFNSVTDVPVINKTFVQTSAPTTGMVAGDTWLDSDGGYAVYTYSGSSWVAGGAKTYSQTAAPTSGMITGDLWIDTDDNNRVYRYNGTSWVDQTLTSGGIIKAINGTTNTTTIDGWKITTGSITTTQLNAADIKAGNIFVDNTLRSSDFTTIGGAGFRLKSNAAGTSADPTIYGAYIKGGVVEGSRFVSAAIDISSNRTINYALNQNNTGVLFVNKIVYSTRNAGKFPAATTWDVNTVYGVNYSSGFMDDRILSNSCFRTIVVNGGGSSFLGELSESIDGGPYVSIGSLGNGSSYFSVMRTTYFSNRCDYRVTGSTNDYNITIGIQVLASNLA